jgi:hypothetical protein
MTLTEVSLRELSVEERHTLEQLAHSRTAQARLVERAQILLAIADGRRPSQVAKDLGLSRPTVYTWIHRFNEQGLHGLGDWPRSGHPHTIPPSIAPRSSPPRCPTRSASTYPSAAGHWTACAPTSTSRRTSRSSGAGSMRSSWRRACGGGIKRPGSASGSIPTSLKKGGHPAARHPAAGGLGRRLSGRDGAASGQELPRPGARPHRAEGLRRRSPPGRAGPAGGRLRPSG